MNKNNRILIVFVVIFLVGVMVMMKSIGLSEKEMMKIMSAHGGEYGY